MPMQLEPVHDEFCHYCEREARVFHHDRERPEHLLVPRLKALDFGFIQPAQQVLKLLIMREWLVIRAQCFTVLRPL